MHATSRIFLEADKHLFQLLKMHLFYSNGLGQVTWEVDVQTLPNSKPICYQLKRDDVKKTLQAIDGLRDLDLLSLISREFGVVWIADHNRMTTASND